MRAQLDDMMRISTHAPAGGATVALSANALREVFLLTLLREGRRRPSRSRTSSALFLLTPLREGRRSRCLRTERRNHFYSRPCGRGDLQGFYARPDSPLHFYSRPCGRGDMDDPQL